ncbi:Metallopeptidase M24 family protein [Klebsormidium nitens]|uniref:Xaa-Pro dipeptidase n=1 Tax=Klebsormidium nitens TaxID=105231 RepID=A0A1Y1HWQ9_KLENI|nr:Metallopeptidase M24 family protein [Klebsormidium nitens]|eukprot:GAQ81411.1 Metallopeptidase M24 family protein [Klebsormidium nitens]
MVVEEGTAPPAKAMETDKKLIKKPVNQPRFEKYVVPMSLHAENRAKLVKALGETLSAAGKENGVVLLQGGEQQTRYDTDHEPLFRQESYFAYLFGVTEAGFYGAVDVATGKSILFAPRLPSEYAIWMGKIQPPQHFKDKYEVDEAKYVDELSATLMELGGEGGAPTLLLLHGKNSDSGSWAAPAEFEGIGSFLVDKTTLFPVLSECRVRKSQAELDLLRYVNRVSTAAHIEVMRRVKPGMTEYQLESLFQHFCYFEGGCRHCSYTCICASGDNAATLHYGHAGAPNDKILSDGDLILLDMGAEYHCYASDITCTYPVNGKFTEGQETVYNSVLAASEAVMEAMKPGVAWPDLHRLAERRILEGLVEGGVLIGSVDEMLEADLGAVFMPHGLGHFMGLDTHDVGGYPEGVKRSEKPGLRSLRTARTLEEGMVITVEPGCYFVEATLGPALQDPDRSRFFVLEEIEKLRGSGGVRIEDDVIVTADGCENMTDVPRKTYEIERVMAGESWPLPVSRG